MKSLKNPVSIDCDALSKREDLIKIFKKHKVRFAYLFGSQLTEYVNEESDVDIAVMLPQKGESKREAGKRFDARVELMSDLSRAFKKEVDVIILNDVKSIFFKYIIMKEGQCIYSIDEDGRVMFEYNTMTHYFDFAPFLEAYNRAYVERTV